MEKKKVVIALGGNALGNNIQEQKEAVAKTAQVIVDLAAQGLSWLPIIPIIIWRLRFLPVWP